MNAIHRITGYEKRTERLEREHDIPADKLGDVLALARVPQEDEGALGSYPLDAQVVGEVGQKLGKTLNAEAFDWFVEPFSPD